MARQPQPNKSTPLIRRSTLTIPAPGGRQILRVGSEAWHDWLMTATHFYVQHPMGGFACRKQRAQRGSPYWIAYRRVGRMVYRTYMGGEAAIDQFVIDAAARHLAQKVTARAPAGRDASSIEAE
jgi:hypothetical protein